MHALSELFLYQAARAEHVQQKIIPAIKQGRTIFCDRFTTSTLAYQGAGRKLSLKLIHLLNDQATFGIKIDAIIWLKLDRKTAQERTQNRGQENRLDREKEQFHLAVMKGFELEYKKNKSKFIVLDAAQSPDDIFNHLIEHPLWKKLFSESRKKKKNEYQKN
jgi:dTMP kinase